MDLIRPLQAADIASADAILRAAHKVDFSFAPLLARNLCLTPESYWLLETADQPVGVVGYTSFGAFAHVGLMAIRPGCQVGGAGSRLLSHLLDLMEGRGFSSITLYSTDAGLAFYPKHGFRWSGLSTEWQLRKRKPIARDIPIETIVHTAAIAAFDGPIFGGDRTRLFEALLAQFPGRALMAVGRDGACLGFAFAQSSVIGPIAATSTEVASALISAALDLDFDSMPRVILPDAHALGECALIELGFAPVRTSRYFIRGQAPAQRRENMYGIAAYSLG